jgi:hypothetical protein
VTLTTPLCACGQPSPDARLCRTCSRELKSALQFAASIAADLDDAVARLLRRGGGGPRASGHEVPLPLDLGASDAKYELRNTLSGWIRVIFETRPDAVRVWPPDTVAGMARWLAERLDVIRQHEAATEMHDEITEAVARARAIVDRQPDKIGAGACDLCGAQMWADGDSDSAVCERCEAVIVTGVRDRRRAMAAAADVLGSAGEISGALAKIGIQVPRGTITSWASRGRLAARPGGVYAMSEVLALASARTAR